MADHRKIYLTSKPAGQMETALSAKKLDGQSRGSEEDEFVLDLDQEGRPTAAELREDLRVTPSPPSRRVEVPAWRQLQGGRFQCTVKRCRNDTFVSWFSFRRHWRQQHERIISKYRCNLCDVTCKTLYDIRKHSQEKHRISADQARRLWFKEERVPNEQYNSPKGLKGPPTENPTLRGKNQDRSSSRNCRDSETPDSRRKEREAQRGAEKKKREDSVKPTEAALASPRGLISIGDKVAEQREQQKASNPPLSPSRKRKRFSSPAVSPERTVLIYDGLDYDGTPATKGEGLHTPGSPKQNLHVIPGPSSLEMGPNLPPTTTPSVDSLAEEVGSSSSPQIGSPQHVERYDPQNPGMDLSSIDHHAHVKKLELQPISPAKPPIRCLREKMTHAEKEVTRLRDELISAEVEFWRSRYAAALKALELERQKSRDLEVALSAAKEKKTKERGNEEEEMSRFLKLWKSVRAEES